MTATVGVDATRRFDPGKVTRLTFGVIRRRFAGFAILGLVFVGAPQTLVVLAEVGPAGETAPFNWLAVLKEFTGLVVAMVGGSMLQAAIVHGTLADLNDREAPTADSARLGLRLCLPLAGLSLIVALSIVVGIFAFVVPAFIIAVIWVVAAPALIVERKGVFASLQRSRDLTRGCRWGIFGLLALFTIIYSLTLGVFGVLVPAAGGGNLFVPKGPVAAICSSLVATVGTIVISAGIAAIYYELRSIKEGAHPDDLASVFD